MTNIYLIQKSTGAIQRVTVLNYVYIYLSSIIRTEIITKIRTMPLVYLLFGGNQGDRDEIISEAIDLVTSNIGTKMSCSSRYESESWGFNSEPFMNQVIALETTLSPDEILERVHRIETQLGRTRKTNQYEARTIDIDLLYIDSLIVRSPHLTIPHPKISLRRFVLVPLAEIAPDLLDPATGSTVIDMLANCSDTGYVRRIV